MFLLHWSVVDGIFIRAWNCIKVEPGVEPFIIESNEIRTSSQAWLLKLCSFSSITLVLFFITDSFLSIIRRCASFLPSNDGIVVIKSEHGTHKKTRNFNCSINWNSRICMKPKKMNQFSADSLRPYKLQLRKYLLCTPYPIPLQSPIN